MSRIRGIRSNALSRPGKRGILSRHFLPLPSSRGAGKKRKRMDTSPLTIEDAETFERQDAPDAGPAVMRARLALPIIQNTEQTIGKPEHVSPPQPQEFPPVSKHFPVWFRRQVKDAFWAAEAVRKYGRLRNLFSYGGGIGDEVLITAVFRERAKRGLPPVTMLTAYPELFQNNPDVERTLPKDARFIKLARLNRVPIRNPVYTYEAIHEVDTHIAPPYPIIARMCKVSDLHGTVDLRPYIHLTDDERRAGRVAPRPERQVTIVSAGLTAKYPMRNKQWYPERFQAVVDALKHDFDFVQVGHAADPLLDGVRDLRGKTSLRQTAAVLSQSRLQIGHVGMTMHMARAVDCRSVIVYGGREHPYQTGYVANENLYTPLPCSPCWKMNACDFGRECMDRITPDMVIGAVLRQAERARAGEPLPVDTYNIAD